MARIHRKNKVLMVLPETYEFKNDEINISANKFVHLKRSNDINFKGIPVHHLIIYVPDCKEGSIYDQFVNYGQLFLYGNTSANHPSGSGCTKNNFL